MAIFICGKCNHIQEISNEHIGRHAKCPKCQEKTIIHNTISYIKRLTDQYLLQSKQLVELKKELQSINNLENEDDLIEIYDTIPIDNLDIHNTDLFSQEEHYSPIIKWFNNKNITAKIDPSMMDTTGFFDEVAICIGDYFNIINPLVNQIKYVQNKKYDTVKITLSKKSKSEIQDIVKFCKILYDYSFITRYSFLKKDKVIYLTLQDIPKIKTFFNGLWMEWFVLIKLLILFSEKKIAPAIARSINITFTNEHKNELDIFFINKNEPVCIECKTGEFRQDLNKYFTLRKKLNIKKGNFILCVFGLSDEQAIGLTSMYEITVVNESKLIPHIKNIL